MKMKASQRVNRNETKNRLFAERWTYTTYARARGLDVMKFRSRFLNNCRFTDEELETLNGDGFLVMDDAA